MLCTLLGHSLFSWCLKYLSPSYVSAAKLCEPVFSSLAAIPLFGEVPGPLQLAGGAAVLGAVLLYTWAGVKNSCRMSPAGVFQSLGAEGGHDKGLELVPVAHDEDDEHNDGQDVLEVEAELGGEADASALVCFFQEVVVAPAILLDTQQNSR